MKAQTRGEERENLRLSGRLLAQEFGTALGFLDITQNGFWDETRKGMETGGTRGQ